MPVLSRCPLCRAVMPPGRTEARCPGCSELVIPASRKLCARCSQDVTRGKRVRDKNGEYYCETCWEEVVREIGETARYVCSVCEQTFPYDEVFQDGDNVVCRACLDGDVDQDALLEVAGSMGGVAPVVFTPPVYDRRKLVNWKSVVTVAIALAVTSMILAAMVTLVRW